MTDAVDVVFTSGGFVHEEMTVTPCRPPVRNKSLAIFPGKARVTNYRAVREVEND